MCQKHVLLPTWRPASPGLIPHPPSPFCSWEAGRRQLPESSAPRAFQNQISLVCPLDWGGGLPGELFLATLNQKMRIEGPVSQVLPHSSFQWIRDSRPLPASVCLCRADQDGAGAGGWGRGRVSPATSKPRLAAGPWFHCCWSPRTFPSWIISMFMFIKIHLIPK